MDKNEVSAFRRYAVTELLYVLAVKRVLHH